MRAAGLSAHQVLAPLLLSAFVVALISFAFNERVVTRSTATLKAWQAAEYGVVPSAGGGRANVYLRDGDNILTASTIAGVERKLVPSVACRSSVSRRAARYSWMRSPVVPSWPSTKTLWLISSPKQQ